MKGVTGSPVDFSMSLWRKYSSSRQSTQGSATLVGRTSFDISQDLINICFIWGERGRERERSVSCLYRRYDSHNFLMIIVIIVKCWLYSFKGCQYFRMFRHISSQYQLNDPLPYKKDDLLKREQPSCPHLQIWVSWSLLCWHLRICYTPAVIKIKGTWSSEDMFIIRRYPLPSLAVGRLQQHDDSPMERCHCILWPVQCGHWSDSWK